MVVSVKNKIIENNNVFHLKKLRSYRKKRLIIAIIALFVYACKSKTKTPKPNEINTELTSKKIIQDDEFLNKKESQIIKNRSLFQFRTRIDTINSDKNLQLGVLDYLEKNIGIDLKLEQTGAHFNIKYLGSSTRLYYKFYLLSTLADYDQHKLNRHSILVYFNDKLEARYIVKNSDYFPRRITNDLLVFEVYNEEYQSKTYRFDFLTSPPPCLNFDNYSTCISKF